MSLADREMEAEVPIGALWALLGALLYAMYLVLLRRRVDNEEKLNVPMFFGKFISHYITETGSRIVAYEQGSQTT